MPPRPSKEDPVARAAGQAWQPQDLRFPWEWCEDHITVDNTSPFPGRWRSAISPWVKELMEVKADKRVTMIVVKCSAQSAKTQTILNLLCYDIAEDPGPTMFVMSNGDDAADFVRDRFAPTMRQCQPVFERLLRETKLNFTFTTMPLYFVGAGSPAKLQGKPIKRLYLDEVRNYDPGALNTVLKRVRAFGQLAQVFLISTPDTKGDEVDNHFLQGDQRTPHFPCPICGHIQQLRFDQLKWTKNETTKPGGDGAKWNYDALAETLRFECEKCQHPIRDTPTERKLICRTARFIRMNPNAPAHLVSFCWNALLPWWVSWRGIVEEFLNAQSAARGGHLSPLKTLINETLGESWDDQIGVIEDFGFLDARKENYDFGEAWPEEQVRFMAADKQEKGGEHYWWLVRAFSFGGNSRLVAYGRCNTKPELIEIQKAYNVQTPCCVIDSGFEAQEVYRFCLATGWKAFKGDAAEFYLVPQPPIKGVEQKPVRQIYRKTSAAVYNAQTRARVAAITLWTFCSDAASDELANYMMGLVGNFTISEKVGRDYLKQITGERRAEKTDAKGKVTYYWRQVGANHLRDCEKMIHVAAIITRHIAARAVVTQPESKQ